MRILSRFRIVLLGAAAAGILAGQVGLPPVRIYQIPPEDPKPQAQQPQQQPPPGQQPAGQPPAGQQPQRLASSQGFLLGGVPLQEMIETLGKMLKLNFIIDPRVAGKGNVTMYTYGKVKPVDLMPLLQTILRINGATMVQVGDLWRIVPINTV